MARSPLTRVLNSSWSAWASEQEPTRNRRRLWQPSELTRREFITLTAVAAGALALPSCSTPKSDVSVVIVGGGLAGVRCVYGLQQAGISYALFEAAPSIGGRTRTLRGFFAEGATAEEGGEFISSEHAAIRALAKELELSLEDVNGGGYGNGDDTYWIDGSVYSINEANDDWSGAFQSFRSARRSAPWPTSYDSHTQEGETLDKMSVPEWIDAEIEGGVDGRFGKLLLTDVISEYGADPGDQSALNLIYLLGWNDRDSVEPLAGTDEAMHIVGGNDQVAGRMMEVVPDSVVTNDAPLEALIDRGSGSYRCVFRRDSSTIEVDADQVVLALPFTALRRVDLKRSGLSERKLAAINGLDLGANAKLHVEVAPRPWAKEGQNGVVYTEPSSFQLTWDETAAHEGESGVLLNYTGGKGSTDFPSRPFAEADPGLVETFLRGAEPIIPGIEAAYTGRAWRSYWPGAPWHGGAYSFYQPGQYTAFAGYEGEREGNIHFCGEHTSLEYAGYMEGAVQTGERAAREIVGDLA